VICRKCGIEIADKALICYRCGTATTEPTFKPSPRRRSTSPLLLIVIALAVIVSLVLSVGRLAMGDTARDSAWAIVAILIVVAGWRAYRQRR
jgi:amino acid permease